ncbi:MAG: hypothetical protein QMD23_07245 [Candidatus Bathyarchaeia archaeon]|nr:hypothetical protein [Candidatus Bathyarchaeia archaeon]
MRNLLQAFGPEFIFFGVNFLPKGMWHKKYFINRAWGLNPEEILTKRRSPHKNLTAQSSTTANSKTSN